MIRNQLSALSIRLRLPLLICLLLVFVMLVFGYISYLGVKNASLKVGEDRLKTLTNQLSVMFTASTGGQNSPTHMAARNNAVKHFLRTNNNDSINSAKAVLERLRKDSTYIHVELLDAARRHILATSAYSLPFPADSILALSGNPDSARVGKMYLHNDTIFYPIIGPVYDGKNKLGDIVNWRIMKASQKSLDDLSALLGTDARLYLGNTDGTLWTDMVKAVSMPLKDTKNTKGILSYDRDGNKPVIASVKQIGNSYWMVAVELSKAKILEAANRFLYWLIIAGLIILLVSGFIAWLMSKGITAPLNQLTRAASDIAAGNNAAIVQVNRRDEIGKLARAFNAMNAQVNHSRRALEKKAHNYRILFDHNPMPMWIISKESKVIINVNQAAIRHYGYSREDFLKLTAADLIPGEEVTQYQSFVNNKVVAAAGTITRHIRKDGLVMLVDIIADEIVYREQEAILMLSHDITDKLITEAKLVQHRMQQQEIVAEATIQAQEMEREAIGKELHDNVNQILASAKLYLELVRSGNKEDVPVALKKTYDNVLLAISEVRQLSKQLVAPTLDDLLSNVLKEMFQEIQRTTAITIHLHDDHFDETLLNENMKLMIYRVMQEQMTNIIKHAKATQVFITMENNKEYLSLTIEDNGVGFDTMKKSKGIGLRNIENRVRFYKGVTIINSKPGGGCTIEISVPMKRENYLVAT
jgi:PAS domain S-box-containing protein